MMCKDFLKAALVAGVRGKDFLFNCCGNSTTPNNSFTQGSFTSAFSWTYPYCDDPAQGEILNTPAHGISRENKKEQNYLPDQSGH